MTLAADTIRESRYATSANIGGHRRRAPLHTCRARRRLFKTTAARGRVSVFLRWAALRCAPNRSGSLLVPRFCFLHPPRERKPDAITATDYGVVRRLELVVDAARSRRRARRWRCRAPRSTRPRLADRSATYRSTSDRLNRRRPDAVRVAGRAPAFSHARIVSTQTPAIRAASPLVKSPSLIGVQCARATWRSPDSARTRCGLMALRGRERGG